jgi:hypothetical protein
MADVKLEITVPNAWTTRVLNAFTTIADTHIWITSQGSSVDHNDFHGTISLRIDAQQGGETAKEFGERVLRELGKSIVKLVELAQDTDRYQTDVNNVTPASESVPEDILQ